MEKRGFTICRSPLHRFFSDHRFDVVLDVGANRGQYASELRKDIGYTNRIISFEPMSEAYGLLCKQMQNDSKWTGKNWALGETKGEQEINIAGNSASSSLFDMLPSHKEVLPHSEYVNSETIQVRALDDEISEFTNEGETILLKIDTQGFELNVLKGTAKSLANVAALQLEISLSPLYDGAPLIEDIVAYTRQAGFVPYWFFPGFWNSKTHQQLQVEGLFVREQFLKTLSVDDK